VYFKITNHQQTYPNIFKMDNEHHQAFFFKHDLSCFVTLLHQINQTHGEFNKLKKLALLRHESTAGHLY
jgi:hypothetical protein